jgi:predicted tellurium resistance membrane protein TerC
MDISWLLDPQIWASLVTLTALEIVLGIDNLVFIAILVGRLPEERRDPARKLGLAAAVITRLALLASIAWIIGLTRPVFELFGHAFAWRDIILIAGGLFLLYKGTREIHERLEGDGPHADVARVAVRFSGVIVQIMILDIVFSIDSVITAVGMANEFWVMAAAVIIAVAIMIAASGPLAEFIERHPTIKMLALSFLLLIGTTLVADGIGFHVPKGYIYAAIAFSVMVEALNQMVSRRRRRSQAVSAEAESAPPAQSGGEQRPIGS